MHLWMIKPIKPSLYVLTPYFSHLCNLQLLMRGSLIPKTPPAFLTIITMVSSSPQADLRVARPLAVSALPQVYLPLDGSSSTMAQRLQPVLILEPHTGLVHSQLVSRELCNCKCVVLTETEISQCVVICKYTEHMHLHTHILMHILISFTKV